MTGRREAAPLRTGAGRARAGARGRRAPDAGAPSRATRTVVLGVVGVLFALPLVAMVEFSLRTAGGYGLDHWAAILAPENARTYRNLFAGVTNSLVLAVATVAIMLALLVPTMVLVRLRLPHLQRALELVCLLPITIPAIVLVVGLAPVYSVVARVFGSDAWTLALAYGVLVLPYAYRAIAANLAAVDAVTLAEAARTLGAGWPTVVVRVILPNLRRGLLAASLISVAVVLGEYTIASLLNRANLQTAVVQVSKSDPYVAVIFAMLALALGFVLLFVMGRASAARPGRKS
ncbi:ABC transporter permease subunit [Georgenia ruanii]